MEQKVTNEWFQQLSAAETQKATIWPRDQLNAMVEQKVTNERFQQLSAKVDHKAMIEQLKVLSAMVGK